MSSSENDWVTDTKEWLAKVNSTECAEELMYVPSELSRLGVAPVDVVDRLDWLRGRGDSMKSPPRERVVGRSKVAPSSVMVLERPEVAEETDLVVTPVTPEDPPESPSQPVMVGEPEKTDPEVITQPWSWVESTIERDLQESLRSLFAPEPGLHEFNTLVSLLVHPVKKTRGKRARSSVGSTL